MASNPLHSQFSSDLTSVAQQELLQALLADDATYCWDVTVPESESYFAKLEREFSFDDWNSAEMRASSQNFFSSLDLLWTPEVSHLAAKNTSYCGALLRRLSARFGSRTPQTTLETIAKAAEDLVSSNLSLAEKLVECVRQVTLEWTTEDLLVMSRPLAYTMRGQECQGPIESFLSTVRSVPFSELSEMEKARLNLAVARYALAELEIIAD